MSVDTLSVGRSRPAPTRRGERVDEWDILTAMGWAVVTVDGMDDSVCVVASQRVVLVRTGADEADATLMPWALSRALEHESRRHPQRA